MKLFIFTMMFSIGTLWMQFWCDFKLRAGLKLTRAEEVFVVDQEFERLMNTDTGMRAQTRRHGN